MKPILVSGERRPWSVKLSGGAWGPMLPQVILFHNRFDRIHKKILLLVRICSRLRREILDQRSTHKSPHGENRFECEKSVFVSDFIRDHPHQNKDPRESWWLISRFRYFRKSLDSLQTQILTCPLNKLFKLNHQPKTKKNVPWRSWESWISGGDPAKNQLEILLVLMTTKISAK